MSALSYLRSCSCWSKINAPIMKKCKFETVDCVFIGNVPHSFVFRFVVVKSGLFANPDNHNVITRQPPPLLTSISLFPSGKFYVRKWPVASLANKYSPIIFLDKPKQTQLTAFRLHILLPVRVYYGLGLEFKEL